MRVVEKAKDLLKAWEDARQESKASFDNNNMYIEKFIENIFSDRPMTVHGNGNHLVDYLSKDDLLYYIKNLVNESPGEIYNISTGKLKKIINVAEIISSIGNSVYQRKGKIEFLNKNKIYPNSPLALPSKIIKKTHHKPFDFEEKIQKMMSAYLLHERKI